LEPFVLKSVSTKLNIQFQKTGLILSSDHPIFGASPDAISDDYVVEIKCPYSKETEKHYLKDGRPCPEAYAQLQLQMKMAGRKKGLLCVADPNFETSDLVEVQEIEFDYIFTKRMLSQALSFWTNFVYPKLIAMVDHD
jgi:YqaJ-like viral recombinase domain